MRLLARSLILLLGLALVPPGLGAQSPTPGEEAVTAAAEAWLAHVDAGRYRESWEAAAPVFRSALTPEQWEAAVRPVRDGTGALLSRAVRSVTPAVDPPGTPPGEYRVVEYGSAFGSVPTAIETVILRLEGEADWRVAGYFVRPG